MDESNFYSQVQFCVDPPESQPRLQIRLHSAIDYVIDRIEKAEIPNSVALIGYEYKDYEAKSGILIFNLLLKINWIETQLEVFVDMFSRRKSDNSITYEIVSDTFSDS